MKKCIVLAIAALLVSVPLYNLRNALVPTASAASNCAATPYAPTHPPAVSETPSSAIGVIGQRPVQSGHPAWDGDDRVNDMVLIGNTMVAVGEFDSYIWHGTTYARHNIVAFDATTGQPNALNADVDGEILTVAASCSGSMVYIGGDFHHVNGTTRNYAAKLYVGSGTLNAWNPNPNDIVQDISLMAGHLVVDGNFTTIGGASRTYVASLSETAAAGTATSWLGVGVAGGEPEGPTKVDKVVANHAGTMAVMIGNFDTVSGKAHRRIALLSLGSTHATVLPWNTPSTASNNNSDVGTDCGHGYPAPENDVAFTPGDTRFYIAATGGPHKGSICDALSKWDATDTSNTAARPMNIQITGGDSLSAVVCSSDSCYTSGHERWANNPYNTSIVIPGCGYAGYGCKGPTAVDRPGMFQVAADGMGVTAWNPTSSRQHSMHNVMLFSPLGLWVGGDANSFGGQAHNDLVLFPFN